MPSPVKAEVATAAAPVYTPGPAHLRFQETSPSSTETVSRPEPGLARGKWEAPAWAFWVMLAVVLLGAGGYLLRRLGMLRLKKNEPPPSSKTQRP